MQISFEGFSKSSCRIMANAAPLFVPNPHFAAPQKGLCIAGFPGQSGLKWQEMFSYKKVWVTMDGR
jgi:hypothetical protein